MSRINARKYVVTCIIIEGRDERRSVVIKWPVFFLKKGKEEKG